MYSQIEKIYELTNSTVLTPHNLLDNIKLSNYIEIKYYKENNDIICQMTSLENQEKIHYLYVFDKNDHLQTAKILYESEELEIFNRSKELEKLIHDYEKQKGLNKKIS
ncbi:hypothetical protein O1B96_001711 [Listeria monocytogenes]|uniref:hypothetical protein n=1 Tax=Enterococcus faecalis TaxID=1351 RepID=UPI0001F0D35A|nr:hypothetical protein [Enterococcus faecalis]EKF9056420.1 hypothetical protein [Listeria monocytogenes]EFU05742.1 hypothetical protein HMPREF9513_01866 [Enterococcus faecalis TX0645]EKF9328158.1 hypothetical protein [Listeria monocytogenes]EKF9359778.1 hypothetical protein [Listeria monocytogenes]EKF9521819.1 hypothetical protein [Listeria monocytogenes]